MKKKGSARFPKVLKVDGLIIPLSISSANEHDGTKTPDTDDSIHHDPSTEYGHTEIIKRLLREALDPLLEEARDSTRHKRMVAMLSAVKNADLSSSEGERRVNIGLNSEAGQAILKEFKFTPNCEDLDALVGNTIFDWSTQTLTLKDLKLAWMFPEPSTHFELTISIVTIDFENLTSILHPLNAYMFIPEMVDQTYVLEPKQTIPLQGVALAIVSSRRYEMDNNVLKEVFVEGSVCVKVVAIHI